MENKQWELKAHSYQIADTGDYDGHYELTNGDIVLITKDDIDLDDQVTLTNGLNNIDVKWEDWKASNAEYELYLEKKEVEKWRSIAKDLAEGYQGMISGKPWTEEGVKR